MRSRHYIEEVGVASIERPVSKPVAFAALAIIAIAAIFLIQQTATFKPVQQAATEQSAPPQVAHR